MGIFNRKAGRGRDAGPIRPARRAPPGDAARGISSVLDRDIVLSGNIGAAAVLHVDGRIRGNVDCQTLTQGAASGIVGNVTAETARLAGAIEGTVRVRRLVVERGARITGDIAYETIAIEHGARIDGRLTRTGPADPLSS